MNLGKGKKSSAICISTVGVQTGPTAPTADKSATYPGGGGPPNPGGPPGGKGIPGGNPGGRKPGGGGPGMPGGGKPIGGRGGPPKINKIQNASSAATSLAKRIAHLASSFPYRDLLAFHVRAPGSSTHSVSVQNSGI
jgi:hypothetical protein